MARRVALIGGSFNPPHVGHLMATLYLRAALGFDEVWLVPSFNHPFGKPLAPFEDRVAMCEAMAADVGPWLRVHRAEAFVGGEGRTIELLDWLLPRFAARGLEFSWVIGSDILADLPKWKAWDRIRALVQVVVLHRAGYPAPEAVGPPIVEVSSTQVRAELEAGRRPTTLVSARVLDYLEAKRLYRLEPAPQG